MGVRFVARKCTQCAGKLEYIKEKKIWRCLYCGAEIEREEQYDGLFTIKNVVRQSLLDTAYRRLESAADNLTECEKIDSKYIGTIIAKIAYQMIGMITPGAFSEADARGMLAQLKRNYASLREISPSVEEEEEALYEFLEEADIYATLVLVYDSLGDSSRRDFVKQLLEAGEIYSKEANRDLFLYALRNQEIPLADAVAQNAAHLDIPFTLKELLAHYPDTPAKGEHAKRLLPAGDCGSEGKRLVSDYLTSSADSVGTKAGILSGALHCNIRVDIELAVSQVLREADEGQVEDILNAYVGQKLADPEVYALLSFAFTCGRQPIALLCLRTLKQSGQYVYIPAKLLIAMLSQPDWTPEEKAALLEESFAFSIGEKELDALLANYLCFHTGSPQERRPVIDCLLRHDTAIPTQTVEQYVLDCQTDGEQKAEIVKAIWEKDLNLSFFQDLLSQYLNRSKDPPEVKGQITALLSAGGLKADAGALIEYLCQSTDEVAVKVQIVRNVTSAGSPLRADAASTYLERVGREHFSSELLAQLCTPASVFRAKAVEAYLLYLTDHAAVKGQRAKAFLEHAAEDLAAVPVLVNHLGNPVSCNLLQAYVLLTPDPRETAVEIAGYLMQQQGMKINAKIQVYGNSMKLKKYVCANKERLSEATNAVCEAYNVYSMLL